MTTSSKRPYLARALWEWCSDNGLTPLIQVQVEGTQARVPMEFVKDGQIVLNISATATRNLTMNNAEIQFNARFNGISREISVPWSAVTGLYARETGEGMLFPEEEPGLEESSLLSPLPDVEAAEPATEPQKQRKPTLTVVK
ncbi:MAG: ClpXP protease specificity-enhancing factor [Betaproteobacteria bacterium]|nr:ClpXP protease specificity-enhancing factor [Betaproteobacteria bacterium]MDE2621815.1 ClpXP protease specificity-enhancing factor [Betaproteobacteria bacterium]